MAGITESDRRQLEAAVTKRLDAALAEQRQQFRAELDELRAHWEARLAALEGGHDAS
jgi:hypothetical protein